VQPHELPFEHYSRREQHLPKRDPSLWLTPALVESASQRSSGVTRAVSTQMSSLAGCAGSRAAKPSMLTALLSLHAEQVSCHAHV